jgi:hypothetical protein
MKFLSIALLTIALAVSAFAADLAGKWKATTEGPNGQMEIIFNFKTDGNKTTGTATGPMGDLPISDIKLDGENISFTVEAGEMKLVHKGTISGNEMKLKVDAGDQVMEMTAIRSAS